MKPYLGVTLHWIDDAFRYHECALAMEQQKYPRTAEATSVLISKNRACYFSMYKCIHCTYYSNHFTFQGAS